jgi:cytochrome c oxidase subunit 4
VANHDASASTSTHPSLWRFVGVWIALCVLTAATVLFWRLHLGRAAVPVAMAIAVTKGTLVALFFMELWDHGGVSRMVLVVSIFFVAVLALLSLSDIQFRFPLARPNAGAPNPVLHAHSPGSTPVKP